MKPNDLLETLASRRSYGISKLKPDPVDRALLEKLFEAANWAPSHKDTEPWRFVVFTGEGRKKLAKVFAEAQKDTNPDSTEDDFQKMVSSAPVWIVLLMVPGLDEQGSYVTNEEEELMAAACAVQNLHLMASSLGIAGMWHSKRLSIDPKVASLLGYGPPARIIGMFRCGWPAADPETGERGPWQDKVTWHTE